MSVDDLLVPYGHSSSPSCLYQISVIALVKDMLIASNKFADTSVSFPKGQLDFMSEFWTMNPFLVPNQPSMIEWKRYAGHLPKIHHVMHRWLRESQCVLQHTLTQTCCMTWLRGDLQPVCNISLSSPLSTPS